MKQGWITGLEDIACYMNICKDTLRAWMKKYEMPIIKVGRKWCATMSSLDQWLNYDYKKQQKRRKEKLIL